MKSAINILEIGTLGGYSSICLAQALAQTGKVEYAKVAKQNIANAGYGQKVEVIVGNALDSLPNLKNDELLFDFIFIDADKSNNPAYLKWALKLHNGEVTNENSEDERVRGVQEFMDLVKANPRIEATAIQTVGVKGYDGFVLAVVN